MRKIKAVKCIVESCYEPPTTSGGSCAAHAAEEDADKLMDALRDWLEADGSKLKNEEAAQVAQRLLEAVQVVSACRAAATPYAAEWRDLIKRRRSHMRARKLFGA